ncbi:MAG TPA: AMP-binding protein [Gemmataceae bacterium]|nr:AMP-binding protein [Gemmataceae bacterium]
MPPDVPFIERLRAVAAEHPDRVALLTRGMDAVTFRELIARAEAFAGRCGAGELVSLGAMRSAEFVVGVVGCWIAGAAFLPLDPRWPAERREFVRSDSSVSLPSGDLAYCIYTSGSTGRPKGVVVGHGGIVNLIDAQIPTFDLSPGSRALWVLSPAFDASVSDIGTALLSGSTLLIEPDDELRDPAKLTRLLHERRVTHIDLPPAMLRVLDIDAMPDTLRTIVIGGEAAAVEVVRKWAGRFRVVNVYGPTEATVCTSLCVIDPATWTEPLLGRPIANTGYHVLDGELHISGVGLARGYLNRPELDAAKFVTIDGVRMYRTGDRVRVREDGEFVFLGRADRQFKLRGQLVEPDEVESRLRELAGVRDAAAFKRGNALVAAVVASDSALSPAAVREHLGRSLPPWMVPGVVQFVAALPRTSSGKVDYPKLEAAPGGGDEVLDSLAVFEAMVARGGPATTMPAAELEADVRRVLGERPGVSRPVETTNTGGLTPPRPPRSILLTGATGFLGSWLLGELLARTSAEIVCLVRDPSRLPPSPRVRAVVGDLERPWFGLTVREWDALTDGVDCVHHCAAWVNGVLPYSALRGANLLGTAEVLRFVQSGRPKRMHYASTLSVFVDTDRNTGVALESDDLTATAWVRGGYAQTKWAAERLVRLSGVPASIYRLGLITGDTTTGKMPGRDELSLFLRALASAGEYPAAGNPLIDITPVDYAAAAIARLSLGESGTFHIANPRPASLADIVAAISDNGVSLIARPESRLGLGAFKTTGITFDMRHGLACPAADRELLGKYVRSALGDGR